jgi:transcriptional regulator with XRE-family HTH domain
MTTQVTEHSRSGWVPRDTFATRLVLARAAAGMTRDEAAAACGLNRATWRLWEQGGSPRNMAEVVSKIAAGLGVDRDWLLWGGPLADENDPLPGAVAANPRTGRYAEIPSPMVGLRLAA